jgi:hypothetical protein
MEGIFRIAVADGDACRQGPAAWLAMALSPYDLNM